MSKITIIRAVSILMCGLMIQVSPAFAAEVIRCKSKDFRYNYCKVYTGHRVTLERQVSTTRCRLGDTWGYDRHGIWVDQGCSGVFRISDRGRDRYRDRDRDRDHRHRDRDYYRSGESHRDGDDDSNLGTALAVGAGLGLLAVIAGNGQNNTPDIASWSIGTFRGYDDYERADVELRILPGGSVTGFAGRNKFSGRLEGSRLQAGRHVFNIAKAGNGFIAVDEQDSAHRVTFQRAGSGY